MYEKSVILYVEITLSQVDTESVVGSTGTHFAISINLHVPLKRKLLWGWAKRVRVEFRNSLLLEIMEKLMKMRGGRHMEGEDFNFVCGAPALAISGFEYQGFTFSEMSQENDLRDRICLKVLLTPLDLRNVSFQNFNFYH